MEPAGSLPYSQGPATGPYHEPHPRYCVTFRNKQFFHCEELLAPRPNPKLEDHHLSAVRDCFFNVLHLPYVFGGRLLLPQPENAQCRGDRDPLNINKCLVSYRCMFCEIIHSLLLIRAVTAQSV
jgi:hypothetical protein